MHGIQHYRHAFQTGYRWLAWETAMFGFGNKRPRAIHEVERYVRSMFASLDGFGDREMPQGLLTDPYVIGFLEVLTIHSVAVVYHSRMPKEATIISFLEVAMDRLFPGTGTIVTSRLAEISNPAHPLHAHYLAGRHDGSEHVRALLASYDNLGSPGYRSFRAYVTQHYWHSPQD